MFCVELCITVYMPKLCFCSFATLCCPAVENAKEID